MEAPDKIYVSMEGGDCILAVKPSDSPDFTGADYEFTDPRLFHLEEGECVEYVRKDTLIEKFCEYLNKNYLFYSKEPHRWVSKIKVIEDFKKYVEK